MIDRSTITGVILCGGEARRMGGREKALELAGGRSLVGHVYARLAPQVDHLFISANRQLERYARLGAPVVADERPGLGPLGGLLSALGRVQTTHTFCCPGDAPLLSTTLVARLAAALAESGADVCTVHDGVRHQSLFMFLRTERQLSLRAFLDHGGRAVRAWVDTERHTQIDASDAVNSFVNVNSEAELLRMNALLTPIGAST